MPPKRKHNGSSISPTGPEPRKRQTTAAHRVRSKTKTKKELAEEKEPIMNQYGELELDTSNLLMPFPLGTCTIEERDTWLEKLALVGLKSSWSDREKRTIARAAKQTPRFLFRAGLICPGEELGNTSPLHFQEQRPCPTLFQLPREDMSHHLQVHKWLGDTSGLLSTTWTSEVGKAFETAMHYPSSLSTEDGDYCVYLAALDTQQLAPYNTIIPTALCGTLGVTWPDDNKANDVWVYGKLDDDACQAIDFNRFVAAGGRKVYHRYLQVSELGSQLGSPMPMEMEVAWAKALATTFGEHFALPVAAMTVSQLPNRGELHHFWNRDKCSEKQQVLQAFMRFEVPSSWKSDALIVGNVPLKSLLRALYRAQYPKKPRVRSTNQATHRDDPLPRLTYVDYSMSDSEAGSDFDSQASTVSSTETSEDEQEPEVVFLPQGKMDQRTKQLLLEAQQATPRYLFRGWSNSDGSNYSGGYKGLNTKEGITPLAFFNGLVGKGIFDLSSTEMLTMARDHLTGETIQSEFSSWAASLHIALIFAGQHRKTAFISIIDTTKIRNVIVHVPSMLGEREYPHEHLAHGVISGSALKAVPIRAFLEAGVPRNWSWSSGVRFDPTGKIHCEPFTQAQLQAARKVGDLYGRDFGAAVVIAILCLRQRSPELFESGSKWTWDDFAFALRGYRIPQHLCGDATIMSDIVDTKDYGEVAQMIRMLRALVEFSHEEEDEG